MDYPVKSDIEVFYMAVRKVHPDQTLRLGPTGGYD